MCLLEHSLLFEEVTELIGIILKSHILPQSLNT